MPALVDVCAAAPRPTVNQKSPKIRRARRARSALAWGLGGFLLLQLGLIIKIDQGASEFRDLAYAQKMTRLRHRTEDAPARPLTVVMLGSSRTVFGLKAFAVAILGGITSAWGVMLAGLLFGVVESLITALLGSAYTQILTFTLVIVALALMPNGLFGRAELKKV